MVLFGILLMPISTYAVSTTQTAREILIKTIQERIADLQAQITALTQQLELLQTQSDEDTTAEDVQGTIRILNQLKPGMTGNEVRILQELLATDPSIYPSGLVTGYYGKLTEEAVKKLQNKFCLEEVGSVGPKTLWKINELLTEGAGSSGKVPPGLLKAPGIQKKLCAPATTDTTAPVISNIQELDITTATAKISWTTDEAANSKIWYSVVIPVITTGDPTISASAYVTSHEMQLTALTSNTTYYYVIGSADASGNIVKSEEGSFATLLTEKEQACLNSGGTISTSQCCALTSDFPNLCAIGACGCSPENSHQVKICDCGQDKCFNGNECVDVQQGI